MARERTAQNSGSPSTVLMFGTFAFNSRCGSKVRRTGDVDRQCFKTAGQVCGKKGHWQLFFCDLRLVRPPDFDSRIEMTKAWDQECSFSIQDVKPRTQSQVKCNIWNKLLGINPDDKQLTRMFQAVWKPQRRLLQCHKDGAVTFLPLAVPR